MLKFKFGIDRKYKMDRVNLKKIEKAGKSARRRQDHLAL